MHPRRSSSSNEEKRIIAKQYEIQRTLGRGSYGTAYLVKDLKETSADKINKVLKQIPLEIVSEDERREDLKEVKVLNVYTYEKTFAPYIGTTSCNFESSKYN